MSTFLADLKGLTNPAPSHVDSESDEFDETNAKVVENFEENDNVNEFRASKTIKRQKFLDEENERYKGSIVSRNDFFDVDEAEGESDEEEEFLSDDEEEEEDEGPDVVVLESEQESSEENEKVQQKRIKQLKEDTVETFDETDSTELVRPFSKVDLSDELNKARAVQVQLKLWEQLLAARIRLQRVLTLVNQLPQDEIAWNALDSSSESGQLTDCKQHIKLILDDLLNFQNQIWLQNENTKFLFHGGIPSKTSADDDEEILSSPDEDEDDDNNKSANDDKTIPTKRIYKLSQYPSILSERHSKFKQFRDKTLLHWFEKTRLASGKIGGKNDFGALEKNVLKQIEQILMDKNRLIKRTQLKRTSYSILGKRKMEVDDQTDEHDVEIFDDDDFYHQLLRELIEQKSSNVSDPASLTRQWLEVQKLRSKAKKKHVDRKASKGRKVRYDVLPKLVNFMAPVDSSKFSDEAKDELFKSLFGQIYCNE